MIRYAGLWAIGLFCLVCVGWTVLGTPQGSTREALTTERWYREQDERAQLLSLYETWKTTHAGSVEPYMALYASGARIYRIPERPEGLDMLHQLAQNERLARTYDQVSDLSPPQITVKGNDAEIRAHARYGDSGDPEARDGWRLLICHRRNNVWLITEDWFPEAYQQGIASSFPHDVTPPRSLTKAFERRNVADRSVLPATRSTSQPVPTPPLQPSHKNELARPMLAPLFP